MKFFQVALMSFGFLSLGACRVDTPDGKVPTKYINQAQEKAGTYQGSFEGRPARFVLRVGNDGTATLDFFNQFGDIVGQNCGSDIGQMSAVWATNKKVGGAAFELATACRVLGRHVSVDFDRNGKAQLSIVKDSHTQRRRVCDGGETICRPNGDCFVTPPRCSWEETTYYSYLQGNFSKSN